MRSTFHAGEREVQQRAGVAERARRIGGGIYAEIPPVAAEFLSRQPFAVIGMADAEGKVWASLLTGEGGFLQVMNETLLSVNAAPLPNDPLHRPLTTSKSAEIGLLAIEPATRRRMRINGVVEARSEGGFLIHVQQAYANCPKYIQAREPALENPEPTVPPTVQQGRLLTKEQQEWLRRADTFFIASAHPEAGADASHRGGNPGFVEVSGPGLLRWPDYAGNSMFNTLGNLAINPNAGLLFVDFETGGTLQLTGRATILWDKEQIAHYAGAERIVEFAISEVLETANAFPLRLQLRDYSPFNPPSGPPR